MWDIMFNNVGFYEKAFKGLSVRKDLTLQNIANQNTPNYRRKYTDFETELQGIIDKNKNVRLRTTHEKHISEPKTPFEVIPKKDTSVYRFDGNNVNVDLENLEIWKTYYKHGAVTDFVKGEFDKYRMAIQEGGK